MKINTKFELGQEVFYMLENAICYSKIMEIRTETMYDKENDKQGYQNILYKLDKIIKGKLFYKDEKSLFATKQELLDSL